MEGIDLSNISNEDLQKSFEIIRDAFKAMADAFYSMWDYLKGVLEKVQKMYSVRVNAKKIIRRSYTLFRPKKIIFIKRIAQHCRNNC